MWDGRYFIFSIHLWVQWTTSQWPISFDKRFWNQQSQVSRMVFSLIVQFLNAVLWRLCEHRHSITTFKCSHRLLLGRGLTAPVTAFFRMYENILYTFYCRSVYLECPKEELQNFHQLIQGVENETLTLFKTYHPSAVHIAKWRILDHKEDIRVLGKVCLWRLPSTKGPTRCLRNRIERPLNLFSSAWNHVWSNWNICDGIESQCMSGMKLYDKRRRKAKPRVSNRFRKTNCNRPSNACLGCTQWCTKRSEQDVPAFPLYETPQRQRNHYASRNSSYSSRDREIPLEAGLSTLLKLLQN